MIRIVAIFIALVLSGASVMVTGIGGNKNTLWERAKKIHEEAIVIDAHAHGVITRAGSKERGVNQVDLQLMKKGQVDAVFFALPTDSSKEHPIKQITADIAFIRTFLKKNSEKAELAFSADDVDRIVKSKKQAILLSVEYFFGQLEGKISSLEKYYQKGIRMITLTQGGADILTDFNIKNPDDSGISAFGKEAVEEMNRLGMIIDITHMPDRLQRDVIRTSRAPVVASHSYARSLFNVSRNIPDDIIKLMSKKGGAVMVSFDSTMLSSRKDSFLKGKAPIEALIKHIDHIVRIAGCDHVGIGSDFEGSGENSPVGLETAAGFSLITYCLLKRGYSKKDIHKILGGNLLRIMQKVEILKTK